MIEKFSSFSPESRVWIYGASRKLNVVEISEIQLALDAFTSTWTAHEKPLKAIGTILDEHFIVLLVDEDVVKASGCGIDKSVKLLQELAAKYSIDFFNRMQIYFEKDNEILVMSISKALEAFNTGIVNYDSMIINTLVQTKSELESNWKVRVQDSWIKNRLARIN